MAKYRSVEYARHSAQALAREALAEFDNAYGCVPDSEDKEFIRQLVIYMIERDI
jgi:geranylgeranyl diphosphate synthase type II